MNDEKLNIDELNLFGDQEEMYDVVSMVDDDGTEVDFFVVDGIDVEKVRYLLLVKTEDFDKDEPDAFLFKEVMTGEEECIYEEVKDEDEYNKVILLLQDEDSEYEMKI